LIASEVAMSWLAGDTARMMEFGCKQEARPLSCHAMSFVSNFPFDVQKILNAS
jgi:hypothetical protein